MQWYSSMNGFCLFSSKLASRSTWTRYHRWRRVCSDVYLTKKSFDLEANTSSYVHPSCLCDVSSVRGRLSICVSKSRLIYFMDGIIDTMCGCRANSSISQLNMSFEAEYDDGCLSKYTLLYISILSDCFKGDTIGTFD